MTEIHTVTQIDAALAARLHPAITRWNRLEGRPRTHDFDRALRAEVGDALWMLSRQWQLGEFVGDDAGSPVLARACLELRTLDRYQPLHGEVVALDAGGVLEPIVERRQPPLRAGAQALGLDVRLAVGRRWLRLLERDFPATGYANEFRDAYAVPVPDPGATADALICAHQDVWQQVRCAAERAMDGVALIDHVMGGGSVGAGVNLQPGDVAAVEALFERLRAWFTGLIETPGADNDAWTPDRLEYGFAVAAPSGESDATGGTEVVLRAEEYHHGNLDWYSVERSTEVRLVADDAPPAPPPSPAAVDPRLDVQTFVPTQIVFDGMPHTRWWSFEDRRTNFGKVSADTTDLGTLMLMQFALTYANDWFVVPWTLPVGALVRVQGIAVTTVFDERLWVEPATPVVGGTSGWSMFALSNADGSAPIPELALLPIAAKVQEGPPLEDVSLVRDEMSNMVWAIEQQVPLASGSPRVGGEAAHELRAHLQALIGPPAAPPPAPVAPIRYEVMSTVPENWLPFIPVHVDGSSRETQLQRAAMLRFLDGDLSDPRKVRPRTAMMSQNLPAAYYIAEEEVPRAGARVTQRYQRTRHPDGSVVVWYGASKGTGRGEASSGLSFDRIVPVPKT